MTVPFWSLVMESDGWSLANAGDLDRDGDVDVLSVSWDDPNSILAWYENLDGAGSFRSEERRLGKECRSRWSPSH